MAATKPMNDQMMIAPANRNRVSAVCIDLIVELGCSPTIREGPYKAETKDGCEVDVFTVINDTRIIAGVMSPRKW